MGALVDMARQKWGRLFVEEYSHSDKGIAFWIARCDCGNVVTVSGRAMRSGNSQSCGCRQREMASDWMTKLHAEKEKREQTV
jgi:hypothetical protein